MRHLLAAVCTAALASSTLPASELVVREVGLRGEALPTEFSYDVTSDDGLHRSGTDYLAVNIGAAAWGRYSLALPGQSWGLLTGGGVAIGDGRNNGSDLMIGELRASLGMGWAMSPDLTLVGELDAGYGVGRVQVGAVGVTAAGRQWSATPQLSVWWRGLERGQLTVTAGWRRLNASYTGDGASIDVTQAGPFLAVGVCWSASRAPWSLE